MQTPENPLKQRLFRIIFFAKTPSGKLYDLVLLGMILFSVVILMLQTVTVIDRRFYRIFYAIEVGLTAMFTIDYLLRLWVIKRKRAYVLSLYGLVDLLSLLPFYLSLLYLPLHYLMMLRLVRLLRLFRILDLDLYQKDGRFLLKSLRASARKIFIFLLFILVFICIMGSLMYLVENRRNGFHSIPQSIYWAVVTITTVGYGDISPVTPLGKLISIIIMLAGYAIIAVPTGIVASGMKENRKGKLCPRCYHDNPKTANYCNQCGKKIRE